VERAGGYQATLLVEGELKTQRFSDRRSSYFACEAHAGRLGSAASIAQGRHSAESHLEQRQRIRRLWTIRRPVGWWRVKAADRCVCGDAMSGWAEQLTSAHETS